jgi:hypothetical protein
VHTTVNNNKPIDKKNFRFINLLYTITNNQKWSLDP